jgi:hypothetical protein
MKLSKWLYCFMAVAGVGAANAAAVSGTVDSAGSAKLVSGAIVTLRSTGGGGGTTLRDTTGADGAYSFANVTAGIYTLSVSATGYTTRSVTDTVTAEPSTVNVSLVATIVSTVSGTVDSAGSAKLLSGAIVTLTRSGGGGGGTTLRDTTGADGTYSFANVTAGVYTVNVAATGYTTRSVTDTVTAEPSTVDVSLVAVVVSTVSGKIDSAGSATLLSGAIVTLRRSGGGGGAATLRDTTGADGTYSFANVTAGVYTLSVSAAGYTTRTITDTVTAEPSTVNVSLVAAGQTRILDLSGTVSNATFANGTLKLTNMASAGSVQLLNAKGERIVARSFQPGAEVNLQIGKELSKGHYILRIVQNDLVLQKWMVVP